MCNSGLTVLDVLMGISMEDLECMDISLHTNIRSSIDFCLKCIDISLHTNDFCPQCWDEWCQWTDIHVHRKGDRDGIFD